MQIMYPKDIPEEDKKVLDKYIYDIGTCIYCTAYSKCDRVTKSS